MKGIFEKNDNLVFLKSDEAHFHLNGVENKQNCCYWATEYSRELHKRALHSTKKDIWCAIGKGVIIGPYFLENNDGMFFL